MGRAVNQPGSEARSQTPVCRAQKPARIRQGFDSPGPPQTRNPGVQKDTAPPTRLPYGRVMTSTKPDDILRIEAQELLNRIVVPGTLLDNVSALLDAIVSDMRQAAAQAAADARELVVADERLARLESEVRVLKEALVSIAQSVTNLEHRQVLNEAQAAKARPDS